MALVGSILSVHTVRLSPTSTTPIHRLGGTESGTRYPAAMTEWFRQHRESLVFRMPWHIEDPTPTRGGDARAAAGPLWHDHECRGPRHGHAGGPAVG